MELITRRLFQQNDIQTLNMRRVRGGERDEETDSICI